MPPVVVLLVGAELSRRHRTRARTRVPAPPIGRGVAAALVGAAAVALVVAVTASLRLPDVGEPAAARYAAFVERADSGRAALFTSLSALVDAPDEARFVAFDEALAGETAWTEDHRPAACYAPEFERWTGLVDAFHGFRDSVLDSEGDVASAFDPGV